MDINLLFEKSKLAYKRIKTTFAETGKLKKVSYSIGRKRFCFYGSIKNGILKVQLKMNEQVHNECSIDGHRTAT